MILSEQRYVFPDHHIPVVEAAFQRLGIPRLLKPSSPPKTKKRKKKRRNDRDDDDDDNMDLVDPSQINEQNKNWALVTNSKDWTVCWSWRSTSFEFVRKLRPHHRLNHIPSTYVMLLKKLLYNFLVKLQQEHGEDQFRLMGSQYIMPDQVEEFRTAYAERESQPIKNQQRAISDPMYRKRWLIKSQGHRGIRFFGGLYELERIQHNHTMVAEYIEPLLIGGHKFDIGIYVALTSLDPLRVYIYDIPKVRFCKLPYPKILDETSELLSYVVTEVFKPPWQIPDLKNHYDRIPSTNDPGLNDLVVLKKYMEEELGLDGDEFERGLIGAIVKIVTGNRHHFLKGLDDLQDRFPSFEATAQNFFEMWRFDFVVDDEGRPFLTEANQSPNMIVYKFEDDGSTDVFLKSELNFDLVNMITSANAKDLPPLPKMALDYCKENCRKRKQSIWNMACWQCPGWSYNEETLDSLHRAAIEYHNRGRYRLVYPEINPSFQRQDPPFHTFLGLGQESEADEAVRHYFASLASSASNPESGLAPMVCYDRAQCFDQGACVDGMCVCDEEFTGTICNRRRSDVKEGDQIRRPVGGFTPHTGSDSRRSSVLSFFDRQHRKERRSAVVASIDITVATIYWAIGILSIGMSGYLLRTNRRLRRRLPCLPRYRKSPAHKV